ncbi:hypothetical protein [Magnetospirillum molischianum]|nr:hypothetical protein [Magnetospirillum molischianum]
MTATVTHQMARYCIMADPGYAPTAGSSGSQGVMAEVWGLGPATP